MKPVTFSLFCSLLIWTLFSHWITNIDGETTPPALTPDGEHPLFYIYEWPEELDDVYPPLNATMHPSSSYDHAFRDNRGAGKLLVPELGLFQTWQFSLYKNMMARLRVSKYRTRYLLYCSFNSNLFIFKILPEIPPKRPHSSSHLMQEYIHT